MERHDSGRRKDVLLRKLKLGGFLLFIIESGKLIFILVIGPLQFRKLLKCLFFVIQFFILFECSGFLLELFKRRGFFLFILQFLVFRKLFQFFGGTRFLGIFLFL